MKTRIMINQQVTAFLDGLLGLNENPDFDRIPRATIFTNTNQTHWKQFKRCHLKMLMYWKMFHG